MKILAYDIEIFPNLFTATFKNVDDETDINVFYIGLNKNDYSDIQLFLKNEMTLVGYNNISYDDPILRYIESYKGSSLNKDLFELSQKLVNDFYREDKNIMSLRYPKNKNQSWKTIDLMKILAFDKLGISLKQVAINLKWKKIQDLPLKFDSKITTEQLNLIMSYNLNDVLITEKLYREIEPIRNLRAQLSNIYSIDLSSASDSKMANLILEDIYSKELKINIREIKDNRTQRSKVSLNACIAKFVKFKTPELRELLDRIQATIVYDYNNYKYSEKINFAKCNFNLGVGGLHTDDAPGMFISDDEYLIQDMDVASYYPNLIINNNFFPQHLGIKFIGVLKKITQERLAAKKEGDKVKADGMKITINSIFGKLGSPTFWLLDAKQMLSTTLTGQLGLLMLVEDLYLNGINILSCNTDGIVCKIPIELKEKYYEIAKGWEQITNLELEYTPYKKYVRRDVNSYITVKEDGKTKEKGAFLKDVDLKKSYHMPIVAKALYAYFINGTPVRETLEECKDIMEFCISQKSGKNFGIELHKTNGIEHLQKTNRFYISKKGGSLIKRESFTNKIIGLYVGKSVNILNDYDENIPFDEYYVNLDFYEKEVLKIVDEIEPKQSSMFDFFTVDFGKKTKMESLAASEAKQKDMLNYTEINKLGRNQFAKQIETIVNTEEAIDKISPRYVYVSKYDSRDSCLLLYCLRKGTKQRVFIDKVIYNKLKISDGNVLYCQKFEKRKDDFYLLDYRIVEKFEKEEDVLL